MKSKSTCCEKFLRKARACKSCPLMAGLSKKKRRKKIEKALRKSPARAA